MLHNGAVPPTKYILAENLVDEYIVYTISSNKICTAAKLQLIKIKCPYAKSFSFPCYIDLEEVDFLAISDIWLVLLRLRTKSLLGIIVRNPKRLKRMTKKGRCVPNLASNHGGHRLRRILEPQSSQRSLNWKVKLLFC